MDAVWPDTFVTESSLLEAIGLLRDALGDDRKQPTYIQTVHRRGYRFIGQISGASGASGAPSAVVEATPSLGLPEDTDAVLLRFAVAPDRRRERRLCHHDGLRRDRLRGVRPASGRAANEPVLDLAAGQRVDRSVARLGRRLARRIAARVTSPPRQADRSSSCVRSIVTSRSRSPAPKTPAIRSSRPTATGSDSSRAAACRKSASTAALPIVLSAARAGAGATWTADNTIVFGGGPGGGLARVSAAAGNRSIGAPNDAPVVIATPAPGTRELRFGWPDVLPGDRGVLFTSITLAGSDVGVLDLQDRQAHASSPSRPPSRATRRPATSCSSGRAVSRRRGSR